MLLTNVDGDDGALEGGAAAILGVDLRKDFSECRAGQKTGHYTLIITAVSSSVTHRQHQVSMDDGHGVCSQGAERPSGKAPKRFWALGLDEDLASVKNW